LLFDTSRKRRHFKNLDSISVFDRAITTLQDEDSQAKEATHGGNKSHESNTTTSNFSERVAKIQNRVQQQLKAGNAQLPPNTLGGFVHLGKTGGSTLSSIMRNGCHSFIAKPCKHIENDESYISKFTTYNHIPDFENKNLSQSNHQFYIISVRDPLERFISVFCYEHPKNMLISKYKKFKATFAYHTKFKELGSDEEVFKFRSSVVKDNNYELFESYKCFPSLEAFTTILENSDEHAKSEKDMSSCSIKAKKVMNHGAQEFTHMYWDYRMVISSQLEKFNLSEKVIMVIRTDHMVQDWIRANRLLGQEDDFVLPNFTINSGTSNDYPVRGDISEKGRKKLCFALQDEYSIYLQLLKNAKNIGVEDFQESLQRSRRNCPLLDFS